ncbi:MAG TPA: ABC transporter substrate-binding protein [Woeseiaceae bacterium]|nr:ABC transporter substrate-binding protein [Woeseiaceae bacterium]
MVGATINDDVLTGRELAQRAAGQTVYFNAWGGDPAINRYLEWVAREVLEQFDVRLVHVKVSDIAESVSRIRAERIAGRDTDGSVDLLWINGENFASLQRAGLLFGPWAARMPNAAFIDWRNNPSTHIDATLPTQGYELPWGTATFTLFFDRTYLQEIPRDADALLHWMKAHPGRFSYPQPPAFLGTAFLKQLLLLLCSEPERLQQAPGNEFDAISAPLWAWLDQAHPAMWRRGRLFPHSGPAIRELLASGELNWMMSFNPAEASRAIRQGELQETISGLQFPTGALSNSHFLAIPVNAGAKDGAMLIANFLISPAAQARKADETVWGDPTVLDIAALPPSARRFFESLPRGNATPGTPVQKLPEPHPAWTGLLERAWLERYTR